MAHDVFISYSSQDKTVADAVCASLEARKIRCWIAPRDVLPGMPYAEALIDGLNRSRIIVLVFSANSNKSPQVMREVERAVNKGIPIIPFRIENVIPSKSMEYFVSSSHWLDALTPPMERHLEKLSDTVQILLTDKAEKPPELEVPAAPEPVIQAKWWKKIKRVHAIIACVLIIIAIVGAVFLVNSMGKRGTDSISDSSASQLKASPPTASPSSTSTPPRPVSKGILFEDDFSNPSSGWPRIADDTSESNYENGEYSLLVKKWDARVGYVNRMNAGPFTDMVVETNARLFSGPTQTKYGVSFRLRDQDNYYCFLVTGDGEYLLQKRVKGILTVIQKKSAPANINRGNAVNHLKVTCKGSQFEFYCNDHYLATITDTSFTDGWAGVMVNPAAPPGCAHFDNFKVSSIE